ncbi:MAG: serine/threonine protein kinase [Myxococcales bacterium]|nr:serine/threonine protein kinase [Myxococcales bacterium]
MTPPPLDGLRLGELLGSGAVATVVRVHAPDGRSYAGKLLHDSHDQDAAAVQRFAQEAELLRGVDDPNIVGVYGLADVEGRRVLLLELVEGPTLATLIAREAPLAESRLAAIGAGIARGLARAHAAGVVHRDLKPANILMAPGDAPKIADFGMARATSLAGVDLGALAVLGTPDYMAPESLDPLAVDVRSDLYALGCILFEMASGGPPFRGATAFGVLEAHRKADIPGLPDSLSPALRALVHSLLAKAPGERPQAAAQVAVLLEQIAAGSVGALALPAAVGGPACAACGQPLVVEVGVCMHCGLAATRVEPGAWTVLVAGPGAPGDKLDTGLRERLSRWIAGNPGLGVEPGRLARHIPRVPFTLLRRVSEASARAVAVALERIGLEAELVPGSALRSRRMRSKAGAITTRTILIMLMTGASIFREWTALVLLPMMLVGAGAVAVLTSIGQVTARAKRPRGQLPPAVARALAAVEQVVPTLETARHRHGLRAVVRRSLALAPALGPSAEHELAHAITVATTAAAKLDALDRELAARDIQRADAEARALLHARDTWAARLLALTAALDAFHARTVGAAARPGTAADLDDLRAQVEALEQVQDEV